MLGTLFCKSCLATNIRLSSIHLSLVLSTQRVSGLQLHGVVMMSGWQWASSMCRRSDSASGIDLN